MGTMALPKFPRRYVQRQALAPRHGHTKIPPKVSSAEKRTRSHKPTLKTKHRSVKPSNNKGALSDLCPSPNSLSDDGSELIARATRTRVIPSALTVTLRPSNTEKRAEYAAAGPIMSDPGDQAKAVMKAEEKEWNL
jgi:hypothetical protein